MCDVWMGNCDANQILPEATNITWKKPPSSNLKNPPLIDFIYLLTDTTIRMKKWRVPLAYTSKNVIGETTHIGSQGIPYNALSFNQHGGRVGDACNLGWGQGSPWPDDSYPYSVPINKTAVNGGFKQSQCGSNQNNLYYFLSGTWKYCHNSTGIFNLGEWCGKIDKVESCKLGTYGIGTCGREGSTCEQNVDWGFDYSSGFVNIENNSFDTNYHASGGIFGGDSCFLTGTSTKRDRPACFPTMYISSDRNIKWNNQDQTVFPTQWIVCTYKYDYVGYSYLNTGTTNGPEKLEKWFNDMYTNIKNSSAVQAQRFLTSTFVYTCIVDFYNQLYNQDFYSTSNQQLQTTTSFLNATEGGTKAVNKCISRSKSSIIANFQSRYSDGKIPALLDSRFEKILKFPSPIKENNQYSLIFNLPYSMYKTWKSSTSKDTYISGLINKMLLDDKLLMRNVVQNQNIRPSSVVLSNSFEKSFQCIQVSPDSKGNNTYDVTTDNNIANLFTGDISGDINKGYSVGAGWGGTNSKYPCHLLTSVQIQATVTQWSPLLILYFYNFNDQIVFSEADCNNIYSQTHVMPIGCLNIDNIYKNNQQMKNICTISVNGGSYVNADSLNHTMSGQNSDNCMCLTSALTPANIVPKVKNVGAMCFSNNCQSTDLRRQGITDGECANHCDEVYGWMFNDNPKAPQPVNRSEFDADRFARICPGYSINISDKVNTPTVFSTIFLVLVMIFFSWSFFGIKKGYSKLATGIITIIIICLITGLGVFCSIDLAGAGQCEGKVPNMEWVCKSKITNITIPNQFCAYVQNCECLWDGDCGNGCVCSSSLCYPVNGQRAVSNVEVSNISIPYVVSLVISLILIPLSISYMNIPNKNIYIITSVLVIFITLLYVLNKTKITQQLGEKVCKP